MYHFEPLTAFLDSEEAHFKIPAVDMLIMKDGKEIYRHSAGHPDLEKKKPVSDRDLYWIYSASKISTCVAALTLIEKGKLALDDPVSKYLPKYENLTVKQEDGSVKPAEKIMTVRHLMTMQGGLDYDQMRGSVKEVLAEKGEKAGTVDIANAFADGPLEFEPGTHYLYSLCHDVLGAVIEAASGMRFGEYLKQAIYDPLGMTDTTFHPTEEQLQRVSALMRVNNETGELDYAGNMRDHHQIPEAYESGGGGLVSSVNDYIKLGAALANYGKALNGYQLLKPETVELYRAPQLGAVQQEDMLRIFAQNKGYSYGLGVRRFIDTNDSTCPIGHFGWDGAAGFYLMIDPTNNLSYVYAQDVLNSGITFHLIHRQIRDLVYLCMRE